MRVRVGRAVVAVVLGATFIADVSAPGSGIVSTVPVSPHPELGCPPHYCTLSGTSMAAPHVAAAAALQIARTGKGARQATIRSLIQATADDVGPRGYDSRSSHGITNPRRMLSR